MRVSILLLILLSSLFCSACSSPDEQKAEQKIEFLEVRINRWTALEGGETLLLRKINKDWSAMLLGDGNRFSCLYQQSVQPKSGWENFWLSLQKEGLLEIPDGKYDVGGWLDGSGFVVEVFYQDALKRYSFFLPEKLETKEAKQILQIGNIISAEFDTPMFKAGYSRKDVGDYLIKECESFREGENK
jgi:hypothetical protein